MSFANESAAVLNDIWHQHIKNLIGKSSGETWNCLFYEITGLWNFILSGRVNTCVTSFLYVASVYALIRKMMVFVSLPLVLLYPNLWQCYYTPSNFEHNCVLLCILLNILPQNLIYGISTTAHLQVILRMFYRIQKSLIDGFWQVDLTFNTSKCCIFFCKNFSLLNKSTVLEDFNILALEIRATFSDKLYLLLFLL